MIINKLNLLLAERYIKASKLSKETGIAQSTISKIVNNSTTQIDYATLDSLCRFLEVTPSDFFEFDPISLKLHSFELEENLEEGKEESENRDIKYFVFYASYYEGVNAFRAEKYLVYVDGSYVNVYPNSFSQNGDEYFIRRISELSIGLQRALSEKVEDFVIKNLKEYLTLGKAETNSLNIDVEILPKEPLLSKL